MKREDFHRYNPGGFLSEWFPEQTKSPLHIVIWTIVFIADLVAVFFLLEHFGINWIGSGGMNYNYLYLFALIGGGLVLFWVETFVYNKLHALFR